MEVRVRILEFNTSPRFPIVRDELDRLSVHYRIENLGTKRDREEWLSLECVIGESDPHFSEIHSLIERHGLKAEEGVYFSDEEVSTAEWVFAVAGEYQYPQPDDLGYLQATYNLANYCPRCGIGSVQDRPFRLKRDFTQRASQFLGLHWVHDVVFARPRAKDLFQRVGITGVEFKQPIYHMSAEPIPSVYQMHILEVSRPGLTLRAPSIVTCKKENEESHIEGLGRLDNRFGDLPYCGRVKFHHPRKEPITVRREALSALPDIVLSYEYFGSGAGAHRLILMRHTVVQAIMDNCLKGLKLTPVQLA